MRTLLTIGLVSACSAPPAPAPAPPTRPEPLVVAPSCADAGVLLRGVVSDQDKVGKLKEALITKVCTTDAWDAKILACVASTAVPAECLSSLTPEQVSSYEEELAAWHGRYGYDEDVPGDDPPPPEEDDWIDCDDAVKRTEAWPPPLTLEGADKTFAAELRTRALIKLCNVDEWSSTVRSCMAETSDASPSVCIAELEPAQQKAIATTLAATDKLAARALALAARPAKVGCKQVVAAHYSDAKWKRELTEVKGAERKKVIEASRKKMMKACTDESWPAAERACMVGEGGEACYGVAGRAGRWGFPAAGVLVATGIPECDEYGQTLLKLAVCDKLPEATRGTLLESYTFAAVYWLKATGDEQANAGAACKAADDAIRQSGISLGCAI
jgi:hypothetical protein